MYNSIVSRLRQYSWLRVHVPWVIPAVICSLGLYIQYISKSRYPTAPAGLYWEMANQIAQHPPLPKNMPLYTEDGIPFAYPPLTYYLLNGIQILPLTELQLTLHVSKIITTLYIIPAYAIAHELLDSRLGSSNNGCDHRSYTCNLSFSL